MILNRVVDNITKSSLNDLAGHNTHEELVHALPVIENRLKMFRSGVIMLAAIGLHNLPEGIAIGAGGTLDFRLGMVLALTILIHNLPVGMAISAPLLAGGVKKLNVIALTALTGVPMLLGGLLGVLVGNISDTAVALSIAIASGAMLYVVFGEIIPQSVVMIKSRTVTIITLSGILLALALSMLHLG
jgi:ZIP family zinc transporter